jgi:hypothetical protein
MKINGFLLNFPLNFQSHVNTRVQQQNGDGDDSEMMGF